MRLEKIQTEQQTRTKPYIAKTNEGWGVYDTNKTRVQVFEDMDKAKSYLKKHLPELKEGRKPVIYMSELMEGVLDDTDDDGWMAKSELYKIAKYAIALHGMISDTDSLDPWVQAKITKASDYMGSIKHYLEYVEINSPGPGMEAPEFIDDMPDEDIF